MDRTFLHSYHATVQALSPLATLPSLAFLAALILHLFALRAFPRWGLLDFPERYGLTRDRLPYPTGILAILAFLAFFLILQPLTLKTGGIIFAILLLALVCVIDDRKPLSPYVRIGAQGLVIALLIVTGTRIEAVTNPLPGGMLGDDTSVKLVAGWAFVISILFTAGWLLLTINALNWFDGIPGQVSTLSTIGFLTLGFLALSDRVQQPALALLAFTLAGIAASCLLFDFPPPRVLMGDTGAMFFGLMLGILTVFSGGKVATAFLVLGIPLIDVVFVIIRRLLRGQSPLKGNTENQHLHHRLLAKGWSPRQVIFLTAGIGTAFGITALFLDTWEKVAAAAILFLVMLGLSFYSRK